MMTTVTAVDLFFLLVLLHWNSQSSWQLRFSVEKKKEVNSSREMISVGRRMSTSRLMSIPQFSFWLVNERHLCPDLIHSYGDDPFVFSLPFLFLLFSFSSNESSTSIMASSSSSSSSRCIYLLSRPFSFSQFFFGRHPSHRRKTGWIKYNKKAEKLQKENELCLVHHWIPSPLSSSVEHVRATLRFVFLLVVTFRNDVSAESCPLLRIERQVLFHAHLKSSSNSPPQAKTSHGSFVPHRWTSRRMEKSQRKFYIRTKLSRSCHWHLEYSRLVLQTKHVDELHVSAIVHRWFHPALSLSTQSGLLHRLHRHIYHIRSLLIRENHLQSAFVVSCRLDLHFSSLLAVGQLAWLAAEEQEEISRISMERFLLRVHVVVQCLLAQLSLQLFPWTLSDLGWYVDDEWRVRAFILAVRFSLLLDWSSDMSVPFDIKLMYFVQCGFYLHSIYGTLYMDYKRKDFYAMLIHHVLTMTLIFVSYATRWVGSDREEASR